MNNNLLIRLLLASSVLSSVYLAASNSVGFEFQGGAYYTITRCPVAGQYTSPTHPIASLTECALACLVSRTCVVFNTDSNPAGCALSTMGQSSLWPLSDACKSYYRSELYNSPMTAFWDFRLRLGPLLLPGGSGGAFSISGSSVSNSNDGLLMAGATSGNASLTSIADTPFANLQNFSQYSFSMFMRVRRHGNASLPNGYFSFHSCIDQRRAVLSLFDDAEGRLSIFMASGSPEPLCVDQIPAGTATDADYVTLGFQYNASSSRFTLWRTNKRSTECQPVTLTTDAEPIEPLCISLGAADTYFNSVAKAYRLFGSIRCLLIAKAAVDIRVVEATFLGC